jgi:hypothetical protein
MASGMANPLKDGVNKRGDGGAAGEDDEHPEEQQGDDNGQEPIFFAHPHEAPQVSYKVHRRISPDTNYQVILPYFS